MSKLISELTPATSPAYIQSTDLIPVSRSGTTYRTYINYGTGANATIQLDGSAQMPAVLAGTVIVTDPTESDTNTLNTTLNNMFNYTAPFTDAVDQTLFDKLAQTVSVKDFGAVGDGVTDDTAAIQAALDWVAASGGNCYLPAGIYLCSAAIQIGSKTVFYGAGKQASQLKFTHTGNGIESLYAINTNNAARTSIRDMWVRCENGANAGAGFVQIAGTYIDLFECLFNQWAYGTVFDQTEVSTIMLCDYSANTTADIWLLNGTDWTPGSIAYYTNRITISNNQFNSPVSRSIIDDGGYAHSYINNNFNNSSGTYIRACAVSGLMIEGNEMELGTTTPIILSDTTNSGAARNSTNSFSICNNFIQTIGAAEIVLINSGNSGRIQGNKVFGYTTQAFNFNNTLAYGIDIGNNSKVLVGASATSAPFVAAAKLSTVQQQGVYTQNEQTYVTAALGSTGSQVITPAGMFGIEVGTRLLCKNNNESNSEYVTVTNVTVSTFTATFASTKSANWLIEAINPTTLNATNATSSNTASTVVKRDASGNFSAGTITAALTGNATSATNVASGSANAIPYNTASSTTSFITQNAVAANYFLSQNNSGTPAFIQPAATDLSDFTNAGSWTLSDQSGAGLVFTGTSTSYFKIGKLVFAFFKFTFPATADGTVALIGTLPATCANVGAAQQGFITQSDLSAILGCPAIANTTTFHIYSGTAGGNRTNAQCSGKTFQGIVIYYTA